MRYCSVNTKVLAMEARGREIPNNLVKDGTGLMSFIHHPPAKKLVSFMINSIETNEIGLEYYLTLWKHISMLDKLSQAIMKKIVGTEIDLQNILWIYRLKKFYGIYGESTFGHLIPISHRLTRETLLSLANLKTVSELMTKVNQTKYGNIFEDFSHGEVKIYNTIYDLYKRETRKNNNSIATVCRYLYSFK